MSHIIPFTFEGIAIKESCWIDGRPHFTTRSIGEWLEAKGPMRYVRKIVERNPHIRQFATVVKLTTVEGGREVIREVEVFDPIGLQLIVNKSNQPRAIAFQVAVAHLVYALMTGDLKPSRWSQKGDLVSAARQILSAPPTQKRKELVADLARREGVSLAQTYRRIVMATGERLVTAQGRPRRVRADRGSYRDTPEFRRVLEYRRANPNAGGAAVKKALGLKVSVDTINRWLRECMGSVTVH